MSFKDEILVKHDELLQTLTAKTELVNRLVNKLSVLEEQIESLEANMLIRGGTRSYSRE